MRTGASTWRPSPHCSIGVHYPPAITVALRAAHWHSSPQIHHLHLHVLAPAPQMSMLGRWLLFNPFWPWYKPVRRCRCHHDPHTMQVDVLLDQLRASPS